MWAPDNYTQVLRENPETVCPKIIEACVTDLHFCPPPPLLPTALAHANLCAKVVFCIIKVFRSAGGIPAAARALLRNFEVKQMWRTTFSARNPLESFGIPWNPRVFGPGIPSKVRSAQRLPKAEK